MRLPMLILALLAAVAVPARAAEQFLISRKGEVPVWLGPEHASGETPLQMAAANELLLRQDAKGDYVKVTTKNGVVGWVELGMVQPWVKEVGQVIDAGEVTVQGYLDNPEAFYIITDDSKIPPEGFQVSRDLTALVVDDNFTREEVERRNGENF